MLSLTLGSIYLTLGSQIWYFSLLWCAGIIYDNENETKQNIALFVQLQTIT